MTLYSRHHWLEASTFHDVTTAELFSKMLAAVRSADGKVPAFIFDLDSTLYEVGPRTHAIIREWIETRSREFDSGIASALNAMELRHVGYSLKDTLSAAGLFVDREEVIRAWTDMKAYWHERFFSNHYLSHDRPYQGATDWVKSLHSAGAEIIYVTGREKAKMENSTWANLIRDGFPTAMKAQLYMKENPLLDDADHKANIGRALASKYSIVASLENEPKNLAALQQALPESMHVFVETICSDHPAPAVHGAYRLKHFEK